jgi:hypothetical protein
MAYPDPIPQWLAPLHKLTRKSRTGESFERLAGGVCGVRGVLTALKRARTGTGLVLQAGGKKVYPFPSVLTTGE